MPDKLTALFAHGEQDAFNSAMITLCQRHRYADSPLEAIAEHQRLHCCWWRAGVGVLVGGENFQPALRLAEER